MVEIMILTYGFKLKIINLIIFCDIKVIYLWEAFEMYHVYGPAWVWSSLERGAVSNLKSPNFKDPKSALIINPHLMLNSCVEEILA